MPQAAETNEKDKRRDCRESMKKFVKKSIPRGIGIFEFFNLKYFE